MGILDSDFMMAFDFLSIFWVIKVLWAKGLCEEVIRRLLRLYSNNTTVVVVNNNMGRHILNIYMNLRQGDRPSSTLYTYGVDPHLIWLDNRLKGILIHQQQCHGPPSPGTLSHPTIETRYKVCGYIDDVKCAITSLSEFSLVDRGISLFEAASGCVLHRNPASGKVKFLPLGRWKGTLQQEDIPVNYIALSIHLDMIGVRLLATATKTRKVNGDILVDKIRNTI